MPRSVHRGCDSCPLLIGGRHLDSLWLWFFCLIHYQLAPGWALALLLEASAGSLHSPSWCNVRLLPWCWGYQHLAQRFQANCLYILIKVCVSFESKVDLPADSISFWNGDPPKPRSETREMSLRQLHSFSLILFVFPYMAACANSINNWCLLKLLFSNLSASGRVLMR